MAELEVLEHRFLYYVKGRPVLSDWDYDILEKKYLKMFPNSSVLNSVGSDSASSYPKEIVEKFS